MNMKRYGRIESLSGILSPSWILSLALLGIFPLVVRRGLAFHRKRFRRGSGGRQIVAEFAKDPAASSLPMLQEIRERCTECGACQKDCAFLSRYGTPKSIADNPDLLLLQSQSIAYECSLCGLCSSTCPENLDPASLFLEIRRRFVEDGRFDEIPYRAILGYERRGVSPLFSWYGLPDGCDTVFFPGCTLPGTRPAVTLKLYREMKETIPALGFVLDCCTKPSHDLGRSGPFHAAFGEMHQYLIEHGIRTVLTACPNCAKIFRLYGHGLAVRTVYELLHEIANATPAHCTGIALSIHDPCALRADLNTHSAIRGLLAKRGYGIMEMKHRGERTLCCGEGGMVSAINPELAKAWASIRRREAGGHKIVTYCAGCAGNLNRVVPTVHIADLLYFPEAVPNGNPRVARAPLTYLNRLMLKRQAKREVNPIVQRTRSSRVEAMLQAVRKPRRGCVQPAKKAKERRCIMVTKSHVL